VTLLLVVVVVVVGGFPCAAGLASDGTPQQQRKCHPSIIHECVRLTGSWDGWRLDVLLASIAFCVCACLRRSRGVPWTWLSIGYPCRESYLNVLQGRSVDTVDIKIMKNECRPRQWNGYAWCHPSRLFSGLPSFRRVSALQMIAV